MENFNKEIELYIKTIENMEKVRDLCEDKVIYFLEKEVSFMKIYQNGKMDTFLFQPKFLRYKVNFLGIFRCGIELTYKNHKITEEIGLANDSFLDNMNDIFNKLYSKLSDEFQNSQELQEEYRKMKYNWES